MYNLDENHKTAEVIEGIDYSGSITIPSQITYNDVVYTVTKIGIGAFSCCFDLTSITIPNSVTIIDDFAFSGCDRLTSIVIPEGVTSIGDYAFSDCMMVDDIYCSADPTKLTWNGDGNDFKKSKQTRCHVLAHELKSYQSKFVNVNVTFFGDLEALIAAKVEVADKESSINDVIYDLNGRRVEGQLPTGIYIKNGKKYIVK